MFEGRQPNYCYCLLMLNSYLSISNLELLMLGFWNL